MTSTTTSIVLLAAALLCTGKTWGQTPPGAPAQSFSLEGAVIDSRSAQSLGVISERGDINALFRAQKTLTFGILRSAGISLDQLAPEVRARIERFQTTNIEAFRAFSQGLDLKDQGKFVEAREFFRRAAELDPGFALAAEQQQSMPDVNLGAGVQMRAVLAAVAGNAVERGRAGVVVDVARATAAIASGLTVVASAAPNDLNNGDRTSYSINEPGSGAQFTANLVAALSYTYTPPGSSNALSIASANEWRADRYRVNGTVLDAVGGPDPVTGRQDFHAQRMGATNESVNRLLLNDGSAAYWGRWNSSPDASASITTTQGPTVAPALGEVQYLFAEGTRQMPSSATTGRFSAAGGFLNAASGTIEVNFLTRNVALQNLGFNIGGAAGATFSGLNGSATYSDRIASGAFAGNYSSGSCTGCVAFNPTASIFGGHFVGRNADGLVFSTILLTDAASTASGVHLFTRPPGP